MGTTYVLSQSIVFLLLYGHNNAFLLHVFYVVKSDWLIDLYKLLTQHLGDRLPTFILVVVTIDLITSDIVSPIVLWQIPYRYILSVCIVRN